MPKVEIIRTGKIVLNAGDIAILVRADGQVDKLSCDVRRNGHELPWHTRVDVMITPLAEDGQPQEDIATITYGYFVVHGPEDRHFAELVSGDDRDDTLAGGLAFSEGGPPDDASVNGGGGADSLAGLANGGNEPSVKGARRPNVATASTATQVPANLVQLVKEYLKTPGAKLDLVLTKIAKFDIPDGEIPELIRLAKGLEDKPGVSRNCSKNSVAESVGLNLKVRAKILADIGAGDKEEHKNFLRNNMNHKFTRGLLLCADINTAIWKKWA